MCKVTLPRLTSQSRYTKILDLIACWFAIGYYQVSVTSFFGTKTLRVKMSFTLCSFSYKSNECLFI